MLIKRLKQTQGFTLVELIVVMAILSLVTLGAFMLYSFGQNIFGIGTKQYDLQSTLRLATSVIRNDLKYATDVELLEVYDYNDFLDIEDPAYGSNYIFLEKNNVGKGISVRHYVFEPMSYTYKVVEIVPQPTNGATLELIFSQKSDNVIDLVMKGELGAEKFTLNSSIEVMNRHTGTMTGTANAIRYNVFIKDENINKAPIASPVTLSGIAKEGEKLTGGYTYFDMEAEPEGATQLQWYVSSSNIVTSITNPLLLPIVGATGLEFTPTSAELNQYIYFAVRPVATAGQLLGAWELSAPTSVGVVTSTTDTAPIALNVEIVGATIKNALISGSYLYYDAEENVEGLSTYKWYLSDTLTGLKVEQFGETGKTFLLKQAEVDKYIFFEVIPKSATGDNKTGATVMSQGKLVTAK
jgi:prepilin-type N-terminal cleavage/methylation domain-containing protein